MRNSSGKVLGFSFFAFICSVLLLVPGLINSASAQCEIDICKSAEGAGETFFPFTANIGGDISHFELQADALCIAREIPVDSNAEFVEDTLPGWKLDHIECESAILFTITDDGVQFNCPPQAEFSVCTFFNVRSEFTTNIPTLSEWGMIAAAAGLGLVGVFFAVRRRRAAI